MPIRQQSEIAAKAARWTPKVVVGVIAEPGAPAIRMERELPRWRQLTPLALWTIVNVRDTSRAGILHGVAAALDRQGVPGNQLILLGEGIAARRALELVLQGTLDCAGILAIAIPCAALPFRIVPTAAAVRLVVHDDRCEGAPDDLIGALRAADIDERIIKLNPAAAHRARAAASAAETFVLELVATVGRQARHGVRTDDFQGS
jgi:hypothetical protein